MLNYGLARWWFTVYHDFTLIPNPCIGIEWVEHPIEKSIGKIWIHVKQTPGLSIFDGLQRHLLVRVGLEEQDVALGEVGELSKESAREVGELALDTGRAVGLEVGVIDGDVRPGRVTQHFSVMQRGECR